MIVIGYRTPRIKAEKVPELICPVCNKKGTIKIQHYQQYFYVGFIPYIPGSKRGIIMCESCGYDADFQTMVPEHKNVYKSKIPPTPKWMFTGPILTLLIILLMIYKEMTEKI